MKKKAILTTMISFLLFGTMLNLYASEKNKDKDHCYQVKIHDLHSPQCSDKKDEDK